VTRRMTRKSQAGFSLIELMVAMVATMVIAGAVFKLMTAGNSAFRREPELSDRQQQIRMGMSVISDDILRAGAAVPHFVKVFENGLDGVGSMGSTGQATDEIEMISTTDCGAKSVCNTVAGSMVIRTTSAFGGCFSFPTPVILVDTVNQDMGIYWAPEGHADSSCGGATAKNGLINLPPGQSDLNHPGGPGFDPNFIMLGSIARYRIATDAGGTPNLQRSNTGGIDVGGLTWETIARGIEDMQIEYLNGTGWHDEPGTPSCGANCAAPTLAEYDTIVQKVRVRLSARALAPMLQGATTSAVGDAVRGELISEFVPTAAGDALRMARSEL
jgi:prepilin-type N-terminal cleavage/methylation domain-containing protein